MECHRIDFFQNSAPVDLPTTATNLEKLVGIAIIDRQDWEDKNCIGLNNRTIKWVRLGNHAYSVEHCPFLPRDKILLTPGQRRELSQGIINNEIIYSPLENDTFATAKEVEFFLEVLEGGKKHLALNELEKSVHKHLDGLLLTKGRSFIIPHEDRRFSLRVDTRKPPFLFSLIGSATKVQIVSEECFIYEQEHVLTSSDIVQFSLHLDKSFPKTEYPDTKVYDAKEITALVKKRLGLFIANDEGKVNFEGIPLVYKIEKVKCQEDLSKTVYKVEDYFSCRLSQKALQPYIQFAFGQTLAKMMKIEIEPIKTTRAWLSFAFLKNFLLTQKYVLGQQKNIQLSDVEVNYTVTEFDDMNENDNAKYRETNLETELVVKVKKTAKDFFLVDTDTSYFLSKLTMEVSNHEHISTIERVKLEEKVREALKTFTFDNQTCTIKMNNKQGKWIELKLKIKNREFESDPPPKDIVYGVRGEIREETKLEFDFPNNTPSFFCGEAKVVDLSHLSKVVGGLSTQLQRLLQEVILSRGPMKEEFLRRGKSPLKGMLLYGPPGTGKTTLARNIGDVFGCTGERFQLIIAPELTDKYVGETEKKIKEIFTPAMESKKRGSSDMFIIAIDEADAILPTRKSNSDHPWYNSWVNELLAKIDGFEKLDNIFVILITNRREIIDPAFFRPGRIELHLEVPLPDLQGREEIFNIHAKDLEKANVLDNIDFAALAAKTKGCSGADIEGIVKKASSYSLFRLYEEKVATEEYQGHKSGKVTMDDFERAMNEVMGDGKGDAYKEVMGEQNGHLMAKVSNVLQDLKEKF